VTVIRLDARRTRRDTAAPPPAALVTPVTGAYRSPSGGLLRFHGSYRLERVLWKDGRLCAAGVFSGRVAHAGGAGAGMASRRRTVAVDVVAGGAGHQVQVGPVDVDLLGLSVAVGAFVVEVPDTPLRRLPGEPLAGEGFAPLGRCSR
jgi:hypothetical protein